jgi:hypothetical protein
MPRRIPDAELSDDEPTEEDYAAYDSCLASGEHGRTTYVEESEVFCKICRFGLCPMEIAELPNILHAEILEYLDHRV